MVTARLSLVLVFAAALPAADGPPPTRASDFSEVLHGVTVQDPYRWLEDQSSPETRRWIDAQNAYTRNFLDALPFRASIRDRLTQLSKFDRETLPAERGGRYFFTRRSADQQQFVLYMRVGLHGEDRVVFDPNAGDKTSSAVWMGFSEDGKAVMYGVRQGGEDELTPYVYDPVKGALLPDRLPKARYNSICFLPGGKGFYYGKQTPDGPRVYLHLTGAASDEVVFGQGYDSQKFIAAQISDDGRYLLLTLGYGSSGSRTDLFLLRRGVSQEIEPIAPDLAVRFGGEFAGDHLILYTNWHAPNGRIFDVNLEKPDRESWREVVPEGPNPIEGMTVAGGRICVTYLENVQPRVRIFNSEGAMEHALALPALGSVSGIDGRWKSDEIFYAFTSFSRPPANYRYSLSTGKSEPWTKAALPVNDYDFETKQVWYQSKDGTRVPMFVFMRKGTELSGHAPLWMTAYGGFTLSQLPSYVPAAVAWVERGGIYALPNLRGGSEFGEAWHEAGTRERKQNVFDDFFAAAEYLIANRYTDSAHFAISGSSNGGLLMGAAMTQRPELFRAIQCGFPLLDMLRFHQFLLGPLWVSEYGSAVNADEFEYLRRYSPYQNVKPGTKYPAVLFVTGDADTRVAPLHARKMTALLQASSKSEYPVLLRYNTKAGHSGGQPLNQQVEDLTDTLSFFAKELDFRALEGAANGGVH